MVSDKYITKSKALSLYKLHFDDIADLECKLVKNPHYNSASEMCLYKLDDIEDLFRIKYNMSNDAKISDKLIELNDLKNQQKKMRLQKQQEKRNIQLNDPNMIQKIKNKVKLTSQDREDILRYELKKYGLQLRIDSDLCNSYISGSSDLSIEEIVNTMIEMDWFFTQTNYKHKFDEKMNKEWKIFNQEKKLYGYDYDQYNDMKPDPQIISSDVKDEILTNISKKQLTNVTNIPKTIMHKIIDIRTDHILKINNDLDNEINQSNIECALSTVYALDKPIGHIKQIKKCDFCELPAQYLCQLINSSIKCYNCHKINKINDQTNYSVCKLKKHDDPWIDDIDDIEWAPEYSISHALNEHAGCNFCGARMFVDISYKIIVLGDKNNRCICNKSIKYRLQLENDAHCFNCNNILFQKGYALNICSTLCKYEKWKSITYYNKKKDPRQQIEYKLNNCKCIKCGKIQNITGTFIEQKYII